MESVLEHISQWLQQIVHLQALLSVIILVGFLVATTLLQQRRASQASSALDRITGAISRTKFFRDAVAYFSRRNVNLFTSPAHIVPVWFLIFVVFCGSLISYFGAEYFEYGTTANYVLGGAFATGIKQGTALAQYQSSTVFMESMAFLGAYIWLIARLTTRINNNDMTAASYYYMIVRVLTACLVATITRHVILVLPGFSAIIDDKSGAPVGLALLGFIIGWNPTLWIQELVQWGWKLFSRQPPMQRRPQQQNLPQNMALEMIQGLVADKIDRLTELDIDNCQDLAEENPVIIWLRTPYTLELISDWVAQSQLCVLYEDDRLELLRQVGIRNIFTYMQAIGDQQSSAALVEILNTAPTPPAQAAPPAQAGAAPPQDNTLTAPRPAVSLPLLATHLAAIAIDPAFRNLMELRDALNMSSTEHAAAAKQPATPAPTSTTS